MAGGCVGKPYFTLGSAPGLAAADAAAEPAGFGLVVLAAALAATAGLLAGAAGVDAAGAAPPQAAASRTTVEARVRTGVRSMLFLSLALIGAFGFFPGGHALLQ